MQRLGNTFFSTSITSQNDYIQECHYQEALEGIFTLSSRNLLDLRILLI